MKRKVKRKRKDNASFTVEAAVVMGVTCLVLAGMLIAAFFVHDRAVAQGICCEIAIAASHTATEQEEEKTADQKRNQLTKNRFMGTAKSTFEVSAEEKKVNCSFRGVYPVPGMVMQFFCQNELPVRTGWESDRQNPTAVIRRIRGWKKLSEYLVG